AADGARDRLGGDLHQAVALAAARAGGTEEDVADHAAGLLAADLPGRLAPGLDRGPGGGAGLEQFVSRFAVDRLLVVAVDDRAGDRRLALGGLQRAEAGVGRDDVAALGDLRATLLVEEGDQRLAHAEFGDRGHGVEGRVRAHGVGGGLHRLLVARGEGAQRVLDAVAELAENG